MLPLIVLLLLLSIVGGVIAQQGGNDSPVVQASTFGGDIAPLSFDDLNRDTNLSDWRENGWTGFGQRIGVLDTSFGNIVNFDNQDGVILTTRDSGYNDDPNLHGTQVLEVIHSIAPNAELFACRYQDFGSFRSCIDWMILNEVNIINHSAGVPAIPIDGTSEWSQQVDRAAGEGILWVNAAGNFAGGVIESRFFAFQENGIQTPCHEFRDLTRGLGIAIEGTGDSSPRFARVLLAWESNNPSLASNEIDLQLEVLPTDGDVIHSFQRQNGGTDDRPLDWVTTVDISKPYEVRVRAAPEMLNTNETGEAASIQTCDEILENALNADMTDDEANAAIEQNVPLTVNGTRFVLYVEFADLPGSSPSQSIIAPADSLSSLTVGALQRGDLAPYSSQGPTADGAPKPDLVAPGEVILPLNGNFVGTSAAAPVVTGAAALLWQANPSWTQQQLFSFLTNDVSGPLLDDAVIPGRDNRFGNGRLFMNNSLPLPENPEETTDNLVITVPFPFNTVFDLSNGNPLTGWTNTDNAWRAERVDGDFVLRGRGNLDKPLVVYGETKPEWLVRSSDDLVIGFDFNIERGAPGLRLVFQHDAEVGYRVLELLPGLIQVKRDEVDGNNHDITVDRSLEKLFDNGFVPAPIEPDQWHNVVLRVSGDEVTVFLDGNQEPILRATDQFEPRLVAGEIIFQAMDARREVLIDNLLIRRVEDRGRNVSRDELLSDPNDEGNTVVASEILFPVVVNFDGDPLQQWTDTANAWAAITVDGETVLSGQGNLDKPLIVYGETQPQWLRPSSEDTMISFDFNIEGGAPGLRLVFQHNPNVGYRVLEMLPGMLQMKRDEIDGNNHDIRVDRALERAFDNGIAQVPLDTDQWHNITLWISGENIYVYLDRKLEMVATDQFQPRLGGGEIIFQTMDATRQVLIDNLRIQEVASPTGHFEVPRLPQPWRTNGSTSDVIGEDGGNRFLELRDGIYVETNDDVQLGDLRLTCRFWNEQGGFQMRLRNSAAGSLLFDFVNGNLTVQQILADGTIQWEENISNFYNRRRWDNVSIQIIGNRLEIVRDGSTRFIGDIVDRDGNEAVLLPPGGIRFDANNVDIQRIDDCLVADMSTIS